MCFKTDPDTETAYRCLASCDLHEYIFHPTVKASSYMSGSL